VAVAMIAIIDNDEDSRVVLQLWMEHAGHSVQQFTSGKDFLCTYTPGLFKLILMDLSMPDMDGYELLKLVRRQDPKVPVIAVTARAYDVDRREAQAAGFSDFVTKPLTDLPTLFDLVLKHSRVPTD
jgi:CheY-like chemotaxis protein